MIIGMCIFVFAILYCQVVNHLNQKKTDTKLQNLQNEINSLQDQLTYGLLSEEEKALFHFQPNTPKKETKLNEPICNEHIWSDEMLKPINTPGFKKFGQDGNAVAKICKYCGEQKIKGWNINYQPTWYMDGKAK